jgi:hypothetical protein
MRWLSKQYFKKYTFIIHILYYISVVVFIMSPLDHIGYANLINPIHCYYVKGRINTSTWLVRKRGVIGERGKKALGELN